MTLTDYLADVQDYYGSLDGTVVPDHVLGVIFAVLTKHRGVEAQKVYTSGTEIRPEGIKLQDLRYFYDELGARFRGGKHVLRHVHWSDSTIMAQLNDLSVHEIRKTAKEGDYIARLAIPHPNIRRNPFATTEVFFLYVKQ